MSKFYLNLLFFLFTLTSLTGQVFVKQDATGANDGASWENAYTDLGTALDNTTDGEIWIAAGTYLPGGTSPDSMSRFWIQGTVHLYGGFDGTETSFEERDIELNPTILSGDINGDDIPGDFDTNKEDNVLHVIYVDSLIEQAVTISGLTIQGGHNNSFIDGVDEYFWRGGGIYALSALDVQLSKFTQNFSGSGAAIQTIGPATSGTLIRFCDFYGNRADGQAVVHLRETDELVMENCNFFENTNNRGAVYPWNCDEGSIFACRFEDNVNPFGFGGALFLWNSESFGIQECEFINNSAGNAGAIYLDGRNTADNLGPDAGRLSISYCVFENNSSGSWGGAIYNWRSSYSMVGCDFIGNTAGATGGSMYNGGEVKEFFIDDCTFTDGSGDFGAGLANYGANSTAVITNSEFSNNTSATSGGAMINGFMADVRVENCDFTENTAGWGGAMYLQNDSTAVSVYASDFTDNTSLNFGGAVNMFGGVSFAVDSCYFQGNTSGVGGAISVGEDGGPSSTDIATLDLTNSTFIFNQSAPQAGALNISNTDVHIENTVMMFNICLEDGIGGAISVNASDSTDVTVDIVNSTIAYNEGELAGGIAQWTEGIGTATLTLQNNIFAQATDNPNYTIEDGSPTVVSNGGNFSNDESLTADLTHAMDQNGTGLDPMFVAPFLDFNLHLMEGSPCIDAGVNEGAPEFDLEGNPRDENTDIGAYEFQMDTEADEVLIANDNALSISPNPVRDLAQLKLQNDWTGELELRVSTLSGQRLMTQQLTKATTEMNHQLDLSQLNAGLYLVLVSNGSKVIVETVIVQ